MPGVPLQSELTGEHSTIMLRCLQEGAQWLPQLWADFRRRFLSLLGYQFRVLKPATALSVLRNPLEDSVHPRGSLVIFSLRTLC